MLSARAEYKWLILPIENFVREYYGKLLLAAVAAERGWATIIAHKGQIKHKLPAMSGVVLDIYLHSGKRVDRFLKLGLRVCAADEEGLIYRNGDEYMRHRVDKSVIERSDFVFAWGEVQRNDILRHVRGAEYKLILSGNPRFDLLRADLRQVHSSEAERIRRTYGEYILVNTNFAFTNHYLGGDYAIGGLRRSGKIASASEEIDLASRAEHERAILAAMVGMLPAISRCFPNHKIIVRPHPSENFDTWRNPARNLPNVLVVHEGDVVPWLQAAALLIHNSCTTGLQAFLLDKPVLTYMPVRAPEYDQYLPNAVSRPAYTIDELIGLVRGALMGSPPAAQGGAHVNSLDIRRYVAALEGRWAAERIMDCIDTLDVSAQPVRLEIGASIEKRAQRDRGPRGIAGRLVSAARLRSIGMRSGGRRSATAEQLYARQRWPGLTSAAVERHLRALQQVTHRFAGVRGRLTADDWLCIFPA